MRAFAVAVFLTTTISGAASAIEMRAPEAYQGGEPLVIGAEPQSPSSWPATFVFTVPGGGCSSTAVGPNAILTAAHCVEDGSEGTVHIAGEEIALVCDHHPGYPQNRTVDFALCHTALPMSGFAFENVGTALAHARPGQNVTLLGYGCIEKGGHDGTFGILHGGGATVVRSPQTGDADTITRGGAALCFGDSGGAAYFSTKASGRERVIIGVNSRGDISQNSFLSSTATLAFVDWAITWSADRGAGICGIDPAATGCRPL